MQSPKLSNDLDSRGVVELAFAARPDLHARVQQALSHDAASQLRPLFSDIAHYVLELRRASGAADGEGDGPGAKRRKLNNGTSAGDKAGPDGTSALNEAWAGTPFEGVSFAVPQRKKLSLLVSPARSEGIKAINPATNAAEFGVTWKQTEHVLCLPVPEKAQASKNFCILPKGATDGDTGGHGFEPLVWTASDAKGRGDPEDAPTASESMIQALRAAKVNVVEPIDKEFASERQQALRKGEKAYHVKAFKGNKDGYLFFLPTGIFWGFKKPLHFFAFADVDSISYTSVLQRTFNLVVAALPARGAAADGQPPPPPPAEHEFAMLDQADFAGIDAYVRRHGLSDASMAAARKAKRLNVNGAKGEAPPADGEEGDESELKKAEREAEMRADDDDDEEDDENFDPGSEGESEGSGSSDEEEDENVDDGGGKEADLIAEELGSEAEQVEDDDDDDGDDQDDEA